MQGKRIRSEEIKNRQDRRIGTLVVESSLASGYNISIYQNTEGGHVLKSYKIGLSAKEIEIEILKAPLICER